MSAGIVIIGSGFAARTLVKNIRKLDSHVPLTLIAADGMEEYSKPELSHVISQAQRAEDLIRQTAGDFAEQFNVRLFPYTFVTAIVPHAQVVKSADRSWQYDKLVLATGAKAFVPPLPGREMMLTLNSLQEYHACEEQLRAAKRVLIVGAGLIGCELAMDFQRAGKTVTLLDNAASILPALMPPEVSARLQHCLTANGVRLLLASKLARLEARESGVRAQLDDECSVDADVVVAATGLVPHTALAQAAGLETRRGIVVDATLQTSHPHIFALGDCAEINGQVLPFLQPIQLSAMTLAKNLTGSPAQLTLPPMLVKVKTPLMPLHLAGETSRADLRWRITTDAAGMVAKGVDIDDKLRAFVVSEDRMKEAFALLKALGQ
ncbi:NADH:flavorubredoxin reductase NorW [Kosakonia cowanii]|uniref:NADH:flavorubredoxin reductase NorW n=1 Tax=Kosakonia cowanii TaxID=208223 RepID=UPI001124CBB2|nr:NADH:flavorubredoxin reductase NorW [Kosakonia cowanii]MDP9768745.1 nitric oxide reductase FlRd-NAD(+) reductase [Atlantibacter hermannii]TPD64943.1 NADH:flavorubredoxin reductase NorW [Kosakonia cowanii]TPD89128.1 NADH:flavorubredoxin reductase NorW [Kosakonia cowanii]TPE05570.1 NADH:flavorubredoxin reductase NorW [Kosakonia cowanii]